MFITRVDEIGGERRGSGPGSDLKAWRIPQCPFLIECSSAVLDRIRLEVERSRDLPGDGRETGGVLFGMEESGRVSILASQPLPCEHALGPGFVLSEKDEQRLAQLIGAPATNPDLSGLRALGWYHSHLRSKVSLSERDLQLHTRFFAGPGQIALVVHPRSDGRTRAGFFFREASGEMRTDSSYEEFTIDATPVPAVKRPAVPKRVEPRPQKTLTEREPRQVDAVCPKCGGKQLRRSRRSGPIERLRGILGSYPYRCHECLSRFFLRTSPSTLLDGARSGRRKRPEEIKRVRLRTRRELLLWGGSICGFLAILYYLIRDTGPKPDFP